jgi:hypothetical protein
VATGHLRHLHSAGRFCSLLASSGPTQKSRKQDQKREVIQFECALSHRDSIATVMVTSPARSRFVIECEAVASATASSCRRRAKFSRTRSSRERKELTIHSRSFCGCTTFWRHTSKLEKTPNFGPIQ